MFASLGEKLSGKFVECMSGEVHIICRYIERFVKVVIPLDVLEDEGGFAHAFLTHNADEATVPVYFLVETAEIAHRDKRELDAEDIVQAFHWRSFLCKYSTLHRK